MFISNRYKVRFVNKTIASTNAGKKFFHGRKCPQPHPSPPEVKKLNAPFPNRINWATIATFTGAVISYNFGSYL